MRYEDKLLTLPGKSLLSSPHSHVATSAWFGGPLEEEDPAAAFAWLAGEYLRAFGPARVADFAWWTGATKRAAERAVAANETVDVGGGLLLRVDDERGFAATERLGRKVTLLPKWDPYTMGYAPDGRRPFVHPDVQRVVYTPIGPGLTGDANPVVLVDGEVVATWTYTRKEGPGLQPFQELPQGVRRQVNEELDSVARLLAR